MGVDTKVERSVDEVASALLTRYRGASAVEKGFLEKHLNDACNYVHFMPAFNAGRERFPADGQFEAQVGYMLRFVTRSNAGVDRSLLSLVTGQLEQIERVQLPKEPAATTKVEVSGAKSGFSYDSAAIANSLRQITDSIMGKSNPGDKVGQLASYEPYSAPFYFTENERINSVLNWVVDKLPKNIQKKLPSSARYAPLEPRYDWVVKDSSFSKSKMGVFDNGIYGGAFTEISNTGGAHISPRVGGSTKAVKKSKAHDETGAAQLQTLTK